MIWEKSKALTPLKKDFLIAFFTRDRHFFLTGGSALGIFYLEHRLSYDLDLFSTGDIDWHTVTTIFIESAQSIGARWRAVTTSPWLHRFELQRDGVTEIIDFVAEKVPQLEETKNEIGPLRVDTLREIGVNKLCTLLSRSEVKDIIDLYFLDQAGFKAIDHIDDAKKKDGGFDPAVLSYLLSQINVREIPQYMLLPLAPEELQRFIAQLQKQMAECAYPEVDKR